MNYFYDEIMPEYDIYGPIAKFIVNFNIVY